MSDQIQRQHALEQFLANRIPADKSEDSIQVSLFPNMNLINLRGNPQDQSFRDNTETTLGQSLPVTPNSMSRKNHSIYWLGPDEWLIASTEHDDIVSQLESRLAGHFFAVNPQHGGLSFMTLTGTDVPGMLAKGTTLDLHPREFKVGDCAQSGLAKASMLLACSDKLPVFDLVVRRSFTEYVALWLDHAGREFGVDFAVAD